MTQTCTTCGEVIISEDKPVTAWAYYCDVRDSAGRSPFIRYQRMEDGKFRTFPWVETPLYGGYPGVGR